MLVAISSRMAMQRKVKSLLVHSVGTLNCSHCWYTVIACIHLPSNFQSVPVLLVAHLPPGNKSSGQPAPPLPGCLSSHTNWPLGV